MKSEDNKAGRFQFSDGKQRGKHTSCSKYIKFTLKLSEYLFKDKL